MWCEMAKIYQIEITERLQRVIEVEADTMEDALTKVERAYADRDIVLNFDDDCKFFEIKEREEEY
jgi:hypothetical protein